MNAKAQLNKRDVILDSMLAIIVERGLHDAPISLLSERAGASPGVIYHHFKSKQEILLALYVRVQTEKAACFLRGYHPDMESKEAFIQAWMNGYDFYRTHVREMRFLEQYESAYFAQSHATRVMPEAELHFLKRFRNRDEGGVLRNWPAAVLHDLTVEVVARLARQPQGLSASLVREIGEEMWKLIRAE